MAEASKTLQHSNFENISRLRRNYLKDSKDRQSSSYFEARLQRLAELWASCSNLHPDIVRETADNPDVKKAYLKEFEEAENIYLDLLAQFKTGAAKYAGEKSTLDTHPASTSQIRLERITIPKFDGKYKNWRTFNDLFMSLVEKNDALSPVEKMQYLKTHLVGEAARVIQHLDISNINYTTAWDLLRKRFDNKRAIAWNYVQQFYSIPSVKEERHESIKDLMDNTAEFLASMKSININTDNWDLLIIYAASQKLDKQSRQLWETSLGASTNLPTLDAFLDFLTGRFRTLEALNPLKKSTKLEVLVANNRSCILCMKDHHTSKCDAFKSMNIQQRREFIKSKNLCYNCLRKGHSVNDCLSKSRCQTCSKKHHTLLHYERKYSDALIAETNTLITKNPLLSTILLATAKVNVKNIAKDYIPLRALVDSGSQRSFITESAAQLLQLKRKRATFNISGLGATSNVRTRGSIELSIKPKYGGADISVPALVISTITNISPTSETKIELPTSLKMEDLADPHCGTPGSIDILFGADVYNSLIFKKGTPCATKTKLGWILLGPTYSPQIQSGMLSLISTEEKIEQTIRKFWEIEEIPTKNALTHEEEQTEHFYRQTVKRDESGRYMVRLPFKDNANPKDLLRYTQQKAFIRFSQLEKKLINDETLRLQYSGFMEEFIKLGHMKEINSDGIHSAYSYYLPHHAVIKEQSTTTKLRVVFNASQTAPSGKSLNDLLLIGLSIQNNIVHIIMRWRMFKYVVAADIEKMYRQVMVHPKDQDYQRILWRKHPSEPIKHYRLTTVTYGTACAPYLAIRTLHQLAEDEKIFHPKACGSIKTDFYVDDVLTGGHSIADVKNLQQDLITVLQKGGFNLRKWTANQDILLQDIPMSHRETQLPLHIQMTDSIKTLGLHWNPVKDTFTFKVHFDPFTNENMTKRQLLSEISQLFDPIGWIQPCIIVGKIIIQQLWLTKIGWDDPIDEQVLTKWNLIRSQLCLLKGLTIPRWLHYKTDSSIQIHGFCDASVAAYAAAVYIRVQQPNGDIIVQLLTSKSKVAPLKVISIPRLELCGAVLLTSLMSTTIEAHGWQDIPIFYWTDSTIVLHWLQGQPMKWKTFVANRVSEIQSKSNTKRWNYVPSGENPADIASRGCPPQNLIGNNLWWEGPTWLKEDISHWPKAVKFSEQAMINVEVRANNTSLICTNAEPSDISERFSSLSRMIRVIAWCKRWKRKSSCKFLTSDELHEAEKDCVRVVQSRSFANEIKLLRANKPLSKSSRSIRLKPYLDSEQLLRVGGRIQESPTDYDTKHPIIVPRGHLANLIVKHYHHLTLHGGAQLVLATIRKKYWILNGLTAVKTYTRKCIPCFRSNAKPAQQLMGDLPRVRIHPGKPFAQSGLDYAGPIIIKWNGGRGAKTTKAYVAIFICLCTKAVHLELASDLSAKTCIAAIRRFIARRGMCHTLFSDNGTNFVGADKLLRQSATNMITEAQETLASNNINWKFIPPGSPHFGGIWESAVKSMKRHLIRTIGSHLLNVEEMYTLLAQIEACMNSRPLTPISDDSNDFNALTPGHFLTGEHLLEVPEVIGENDLTKKWHLVQRLKQHFWQRWSLEYLTQLQQRAKWFSETRTLNAGDLVLIKYENCAQTHWPLGRVVAVHPGKDGLTRVVTVKTVNNIIKRPITKICPLPINEGFKSVQQPLNTIQDRDPMKRKAEPKNIASKFSKIMATLLTVLICMAPAKANYTIKYPDGGIYVEHLGDTHIIRGQIRINVNIPSDDILTDLNIVKGIYNNISNICSAGLKIHRDIQCTQLVQQLQHDTENTMELIRPWLASRIKRGLLGNILQGIFGVNDEVYANIDALDANQNQLSATIQHQGSLLLAATAMMNNTRTSINTKLNHLIEKINHIGDVINDMSKWFSAIDSNRIASQFLSAHELARILLEEIHQRYEIFFKIQYGTANIFEACSQKVLKETFAKIQSKLGKTLFIETNHAQLTSIEQTRTEVVVSGVFSIIERKSFELIRCTGIPHSLGDGIYSVMDVPASFMGINYDEQIYFDIFDDKLSACRKISRFVRYCSVSVLHNMKTQPNCTLNEIYNQVNKSGCPQHRFRIETGLWKKLYRTNTWMFLTSKLQRIAFICNGHREDVRIQGVGICEMASNCSLETATTTIKASDEGSGNIYIRSSHIKPIQLENITGHLTEPYTIIDPEPILQQDETFVQSVDYQAANLKEIFNSKTWHHLRTPTIIVGSSIDSGAIIIAACLTFVLCKLKRVQQLTIAQPLGTKWYDP